MKFLFALLIILLSPATAMAADTPAAFRGYACAEGDCGDHEEGYEWAKDNAVDNPDSCTRHTGAFAEGCLAYIEENLHGEEPAAAPPRHGVTYEFDDSIDNIVE